LVNFSSNFSFSSKEKWALGFLKIFSGAKITHTHIKFPEGEFSENFVPKPTNSHSEPPKVQKNKFQGPPWAEDFFDFESKRIPKEDSGKRKPTKKCHFAKVSENLNCTFRKSKAKTPRPKGMSEDPKKVRPPLVSGASMGSAGRGHLIFLLLSFDHATPRGGRDAKNPTRRAN